MALLESGEMYLETILVLSKSTLRFARLTLANIWAIQSPAFPAQ